MLITLELFKSTKKIYYSSDLNPNSKKAKKNGDPNTNIRSIASRNKNVILLFQFKYHRLITLYANEKLNFIAIIDFILIIFSPIFAFHEQRKLNKMRKRIDLIKIKFAITLKRYMFIFRHTHKHIYNFD